MESDVNILKQIFDYPSGTFSVAVARLLKQMQALHIPPQTRIGIVAEQTLETAAAIWAILAIGCIFVPIEETYPQEKKQQILQESGCALLVCGGVIQPLKTASVSAPGEEKLAYIVFTSGTTGNPKGVKITRKNLANYIQGFDMLFPIVQTDRVLISTSMAFDLAYTGLFMAFQHNCSLYVATKEQVTDPSRLLDIIARERITVLKITPTLLDMLVIRDREATCAVLGRVRLLILGGEMINAALIMVLLTRAPRLTVINHYGPCETTIGCCAKVITLENCATFQKVPTIGKPFAGNHIAIVDETMQEISMGQTGRVLIFGKGVGAGYLQSSAVPSGYCTWKQQPAFLTSDLGYQTPTGEIVLCGRQESIVKWKGYRLPLQDIAHTVQQMEGVDKALAAVKTIADREVLVCYYSGTEPLTPSAFYNYLRSRLPTYMIPSRFYRVEQFHQNANGKTDAENLIILPVDAPKALTPIEQRIYQCWLSAGGVEDIGHQDTFFSFGMDSLMMVEFIIQLEESFPAAHLSHSLLTNLSSIALLGSYLSGIVGEQTPAHNRAAGPTTAQPEKYFRTLQQHDPEITFRAFAPQRYYYHSGFFDGVVLHKVFSLPYALDTVLTYIRQWMMWDSALRTELKGEHCVTYPPQSVQDVPLCVAPLDFDNDMWAAFLKYCVDAFKGCDLGFFPLCVPLSENSTLCVFFFRHILCRSTAVNTFLALIQGIQLPDPAPALWQFIQAKDVLPVADTSVLAYWERLTCFCEKYFIPLNGVKYVSSYFSYQFADLQKVAMQVDLLIAWMSACVLGELLGERQVPISIWKNKGYQTVLEACAWDLSDFEYYLVDTDPTPDSLYAFLVDAERVRALHSWWMDDMLRLRGNDIPLDSVYLNIVQKDHARLEKAEGVRETTLVRTELDKRKSGSIHGICIYGEIDSSVGVLRLCYSANYAVKGAEQFMERFDRLMHSIVGDE